ncbi:MAG: hypothetical protein E7462_02915 [Ruminococcaceae bacterium]|nr:hypothetical protein [Oscillospiraceae bacterium]
MSHSNTQKIIEKWYLKLGFPKDYNVEFYKALETYPISDTVTIDTYDLNCEDGKQNLLSFLFMCESLEELYRKHGIEENILIDTLQDVVRYTKIWTEVKGTLYLGELMWLKRHFEGILFQLGRLQFCMAPAHRGIPEKGISEGTPVLEIHIPDEGPLTPGAVDTSIAAARTFFAAYFPAYSYQGITCHSWLLDPTLKEFLKPDSNILAFQNRFQTFFRMESDGLLRYLFKWDTTRTNLQDFQPTSGFAAKIKDSILSGKTFYTVTGLLAE